MNRYFSSFQKSRGGNDPPRRIRGGDTSPPPPPGIAAYAKVQYLHLHCKSIAFQYQHFKIINQIKHIFAQLAYFCNHQPVPASWHVHQEGESQIIRRFTLLLRYTSMRCHRPSCSPASGTVSTRFSVEPSVDPRLMVSLA